MRCGAVGLVDERERGEKGKGGGRREEKRGEEKRGEEKRGEEKRGDGGERNERLQGILQIGIV